jgi:hypothetical protein
LMAVGSGAQNPRPTDDRDAIRAVVHDYMDGYFTGDVARMERALHPNFHKRTLRIVNGQVQITEDSAQSMIEHVRTESGKDVPPSERVQSIDVYDVYKNGASIKVVTGRWMDYMILSKSNGEWRVMDVLLQYTKN